MEYKIRYLVFNLNQQQLHFELNQCLIRVGIYPQLQSVLQPSPRDCPISDVLATKKMVDINSNFKKSIKTLTYFSIGTNIIEVRRYLFFFLNQVLVVTWNKKFLKEISRVNTIWNV